MSTETIINQTPINNTIQMMVPPGDETGLYYIPLANLPWQTSWQQLKDHVRTVCSSVERVEVFNESTSGWVSVRGRENFEAALELLNTKLFYGRPTFADGKNGEHEIPIRKLVGASTDMQVSSPRSPHTPRTTPPVMQYSNDTPPTLSPSVDYGHWSSQAPASILASSATDFGPYTMPMAVPYEYMETTVWPHTYDSGYIDTSSTIPTTMPQYTYNSYPYPQHYGQSSELFGLDYSTAFEGAVQTPGSVRTGRSQGNTEAFVRTERRKIIIKGLTKGTGPEEIQSLVHAKAGSDADKIYHVNIPPAKDGGIRGYATITCRTEELAHKLIKKLNGYKFDGKILKVDFTAEGVSKNEDGHGKHSKHHHEEREKKETPKASGSKDDKKDKSHTKRGIVIANGTSKKATENSKNSRKS